MGRFVFSIFIILFYFYYLIYSDTIELPNEIVGVKLGATIKELKSAFVLKKIKVNTEGITYKIIYSDEENFNTYITFFKNRVCKIILTYNEKFVEESDWENIYNQAIIYYGRPHKVAVEVSNNVLEESYIWENKAVKYICKRVIENDKFKNFYIILVDKIVEQKVATLPLIKKLYYKIINFIFN